MHIELAVNLAHAPSVEKNQYDEYVNGPLLRKPETQLKPAKTYRVERLDQQYAEAKRYDEPDKQTDTNQP